MNIQIEKPIEVITDRTMEGLNAIIEIALKTKTTHEFDLLLQEDIRIQDIDFFVYMVNTHIAIHEELPNGERSKRLIMITP